MTSAHSSGSPEFGQESGARKEGLQDARILPKIQTPYLGLLGAMGPCERDHIGKGT